MSIPKIIHYIWFGEKKLDALLNRCIDSWSKHNPEYEIKLWNESNFSSDSPFFNQAKKNNLYRIMSNYARLKVLYDYGGMYLDTDIEVIKPFDPLLNYDCFFSSQHGSISSQEVNNAPIGATINFDFIGRLLSKIEDTSLFDDYDRSSSPELITSSLLELGFKYPVLDIQNIGGVTIFPNEFFNPFLWNQDPQNIYLTYNTYAIHWWWSINSRKYKIPAVLELIR